MARFNLVDGYLNKGTEGIIASVFRVEVMMAAAVKKL